MKLYVFPPSPRAFKVLAVATHLGIDYELCKIDLTKGEQKTPVFAALNPNKRMPVLEDDGFVLWESNAIIQYLASKRPESGLLPRDARGLADVSRWQFWDLADWDPACSILIVEHVLKRAFGLGEPDPLEVAKGEERFHRAAAVLDGQLEGRRFVTGETLTIADFSLGAGLNLAQAARLPVERYPQIRRWHASLAELPAWKKWLTPA